MSRNARIVVGVILVGIGVVLLISYLGGSESETRTETFSGVTDLEFDLENSPVDITAGGEEVVVELSVTTGIFGGGARLDQEGGTLRLEHDCGVFLDFRCRAAFDISVPPDVVVSGSTSNGPISLTSLDAPIDVTTSNGAVTLEGVSSPVTVRTSNGTISGTALASGEFTGSTSNGRVTLSFVEAPTSVDLSSSNGAIEVVLPGDAPAYDLDTATSNGRVTADIRTDPGASETMQLDTSNGDITVRYGD